MDALKTLHMFQKEDMPTEMSTKQNMLEIDMLSPGRVTDFDS